MLRRGAARPASLILGDTNSGLAAFVASRLGIPVYHMEAGNRCYDDRVPEEVNRRVIDHSSTVLMPYTERSRANLLREGFAGDRIFVTGNPIFEVLVPPRGRHRRARDVARATSACARASTFSSRMHRQENVDVPARLASLVEALDALAAEYGLPVICSAAPAHGARASQRFRRRARRSDGSGCFAPFGFFDFVALERRRPLRPQRQRHGPGGVLHLPGART